MSNLLFEHAQTASPDLLFGGTVTPIDSHTDATVAVVLPGMAFSATATYSSNTARPVVGKTGADWQSAGKMVVGSLSGMDSGSTASAASTATHNQAVKVPAGVETIIPDSLAPAPVYVANTFGGAAKTDSAPRTAAYQDADHGQRLSRAAGFQSAVGVGASRAVKSQDGLRDRRASRRVRTGDAGGLYQSLTKPIQSATPFDKLWQADHQDAIRPPAGIHVRPGPVTPSNTCYTPNGNLVFSKLPDRGNLLFVCDNYVEPAKASIVIPVRRAYMTVNNVVVRRVDGNHELPCYSISLSLDRDSWTWGFNASLHISAQSLIEPAGYGEPVEIDVQVGGKHYRLLVESITRDRAFANSRINISGRGRSAVFAAPYSAIQTFRNTEMRTAQQIIGDILTVNGVSLGWDVDFGLTDWLVPAGAFSHNGSYVSAVNAVAAAAGGYVHADPVLDKLFVKSAYPTAPWEWASATPDIELPSSVASRESISWVDRPNYNGIYVSGAAAGVLALVKRTGTAGDILAPMVVDPLITASQAARQRGIAVLGDTGRVANVSLSLPVLPETGIIEPGKLIRYADGGETRIGISRSVQFSFTNPTARQTVEVETHV